MRKSCKLVILMMLIGSIVIWPNHSIFANKAEAEETKVQEAIVLGNITIKEGVKAEIKNLIALPSDNGQIVSFIINVSNMSNSEFNFGDYWVELNTKTGSKLSVKLDGDPNIKIPIQSNKELTFISKMSDSLKVTDLTLRLVKWNFNSSNYVDLIGEISVPQRYDPLVPANNGKVITLSNTRSIVSIDRSLIGKGDKYYNSEIRLSIQNDDKTMLTIPDMKLYIVTSNNFMYPISASNLKDTQINPLDKKEFNMTATIPISVEEGNWKLALMYAMNEGKDYVPLAVFSLPHTITDSPGDSKREYAISTSEGIYQAKLDSLNRLPLEDQDLVVANLTITNTSDLTLPVPTLTGEFTFNDKIKRNVTVSENNKVIALMPGEFTTVQIAGIIPYTFQISKVNLLLQQKQSESNEVYNLVEFSNIGTFNPVPIIGKSEEFTISDVGYRSKIRIKDTMLYSGRTGNIIAAKLAISNEEKRQAEMQQLAGYFEREDGTIFPATIQYIKEKLAPGGAALVYAYAIVPVNIDLQGFRLVVGKALSENVKENNGEGNQTVITGYVSPHSIELPEEKSIQDNLQHIDMAPYTLTINRIRTQINYEFSQIMLDLDYTLDQDLLTKFDLENRKIIFELKDNSKGASFYSEFSISTDPNPSGSESTKLYPGKQTLVVQPWQDPDLLVNIQTLKDYSFNIYEEIQPGYKKLLATEKSIPWMVDRILE